MFPWRCSQCFIFLYIFKYSTVMDKNYLEFERKSIISCLLKHLKRKIKLENVTRRFDVSNIIIKSDKWEVSKLLETYNFSLLIMLFETSKRRVTFLSFSLKEESVSLVFFNHWENMRDTAFFGDVRIYHYCWIIFITDTVLTTVDDIHCLVVTTNGG